MTTAPAIAAACRCDRFPGHPCARAITQEDLRCDVCGGRDPDGRTCVAMVMAAIGRPDSYHVAVHLELDGVAFAAMDRGAQIGPPR